MSEDQTLSIIIGVGFLILLLSSLSLRRMSFGLFLRSLIGWIAIVAAIYFAILHRDRIETLLLDVTDRLGLSSQQVDGDTVRITQSPDGHFHAQVEINGVRTRMLIDSGATLTALSETTARAAGIDTSGAGFPVLLTTANGTIAARRGTAREIRIGTLETRDLSVVVSPNFGDINVIGMNFLSRLGSWRVEGRTLIMEPRRD